MDLTEKIARYVVELQYQQLPPEALAVAKTPSSTASESLLLGAEKRARPYAGR